MRAKPPRALVVDDDPDSRGLMADLLRSEGYAVTTAGDGLEASSYAGTDHFDVVLTDLRMPERDGLELIRSLHRLAPACRVILVTAYPESEAVAAARAAMGFEILAKPFRTEELLKRVRIAAMA